LSVGIERNEIDTPALLVDLDIMEKNLRTMANFFQGKRAKFRPHTKVHRVPALALKQIEAGATGICCQKVSAAEVMVAAGIGDIMIATEIVTPSKINRLIQLATCANITVPVDSVQNADDLSKAAIEQGMKLNVWLEIHVGSQRCGVEPGGPALKLAERINALPGLRLIGLMAYEGHLDWLEPREQRRKEVEKVASLITDTQRLIEKTGISAKEISMGTTGTYDATGKFPEISQVRAGSYLLMDCKYHRHAPEFECALSVLSTVISVPSAQRAVTDAGLMSINQNYGPPEIKDSEGLAIYKLNGDNTLLTREIGSRTDVGDKIEIIPSYLDGTINMYEKLYGLRKNNVEAVWEISARGKSD
jgi:D-serine deaminase-like pyridoxal phosphate-dependent protein